MTPVKRACDQCARKKIRCDRNRPCNTCLHRRIGRYCSNYSQEAVQTNDSSNLTSGDNFNDSVVASDSFSRLRLLEERVAALQEELAISHNQNRYLEQFRSHGNQAESKEGTSEAPPQPSSMLLNAMESLNLGFDVQHDMAVDMSPISFQGENDIYHFLPSHTTSSQIVHFSLTHLGWIHCALRADIFLNQHEEFWKDLTAQRSNHLRRSSWFALYFAVLSTGLYYMDETDECFSTFTFHLPYSFIIAPSTLEDSTALSQMWYRVATAELTRSDFLGVPRLCTIQTIAVLTLVDKNFGESDRAAHMMAVAISMARNLQMHLLSSERDNTIPDYRRVEWRKLEDRHLGRRLWWTLVICDWMGGMKSFPSILPNSFDTRLDPASLRQDVVLGTPDTALEPQKSVSCLIYHKAMEQLASVLQVYVKTGPVTATNLATAMSEVEKIASGLPSFLRHDARLSNDSVAQENNHVWISMQRYMITHVLASIRLTIARASLEEWIRRQPDTHAFHQKAISAAEVIVGEKLRLVPSYYQRSWIIRASTIAAGVFLGLDLLLFGTGEAKSFRKNRREQIQVCITALQTQNAGNIISKRGVSILSRLLLLETTWNYKRVPDRTTLRAIIDFIAEESNAQSDMVEPLQSSFRETDERVCHATKLPLYSSKTNISDQPLADTTALPAFDTVDLEMELFENPFNFTDSI